MSANRQGRTSTRPAPQVFDLSQAGPRPESEDTPPGADEAATLSVPAGRRRRFPFLKLTLAALAGLVVTWLVDAALTQISLALAGDSPLSWLLGGLYLLLILGLAGLAMREFGGLMRLGNAQEARHLWSLALASGSERDAQRAIASLQAFLRRAPAFRPALRELKSYDKEIMSGPDRLKLAERLIFAEADEKARRLIVSAAQRATVVTAVSPRALLDMVYVAYESLRLIAGIARSYGARPTAGALLRLARLTLGNLAVTGGIAATDGLMEQVLGHGAAARLSRRFGEGLLNGFLMTRIGLAAMLAARPVPFEALARPRLSDLARNLLRRTARKAETAPEAPEAR